MVCIFFFFILPSWRANSVNKSSAQAKNVPASIDGVLIVIRHICYFTLYCTRPRNSFPYTRGLVTEEELGGGYSRNGIGDTLYIYDFLFKGKGVSCVKIIKTLTCCYGFFFLPILLDLTLALSTSYFVKRQNSFR